MDGNHADLINSMDEQDVVARTLWGEARGLGEVGMHAVANVISNRVANPSWWGFNWRGVCLARYQFSCWNNEDPNLPKLLNVTVADPQFVTARGIAADAINDALPDITKGADSYQVAGTGAKWAVGLTPVAQIGNMLFYITR